MNFKKDRPLLRLLFIACIFLSSPGLAQNAAEPPFPVETFTLKNGLQVILSENYSLPIVSVTVAYRVGSMHEKPGKTGLSNMMVTLMFQGSRNVERMQHVRLIQRIGGNLNALNDRDKTIFYQSVSSNYLALVLWLESDRMNSLNLTSGKVERFKASMIEGLRRRKLNDPYWDASILFNQHAYSGFAINHSLYGSESDLRDITAEDVMEFHSAYYHPGNAVLCISGNINKQKTRSLVKRYFETIPGGIKTEPQDESLESEGRPITENLVNPLASTPGFFLGYRLGQPYSRDYYAIKLIEYLLLRGTSSRLHERLIQRDRLVHRFSGGVESRGNQVIMRLFFTNTNNYTRERSQRAVFSELNKLKSGPISEEDLSKAKNLFTRDYIRSYSSSLGRSLFLIEYFLSNGSLQGLESDLENYLEVTPTRILGVANRYFNQNRIIVNVDLK